MIADIYAAALVASARVFGDCPIEALTGDVAKRRRSLGPAAFAVATVTGRSKTLTCETLGVTRGSATRAMRQHPRTFGSALNAGIRAAIRQTNTQPKERR